MKKLIYFTSPIVHERGDQYETIESLARECGIESSLALTKTDMKVFQKYGVETVPTLILVENESVEQKAIGVQTLTSLELIFKEWGLLNG